MQAESQSAAVMPLRVRRHGAPPELRTEASEAASEKDPGSPVQAERDDPHPVPPQDLPVQPRRKKRLLLAGALILLGGGLAAIAATQMGLHLPFPGSAPEQRETFSQASPVASRDTTRPSGKRMDPPALQEGYDDPFDAPPIAVQASLSPAKSFTREPSRATTPVSTRSPSLTDEQVSATATAQTALPPTSSDAEMPQAPAENVAPPVAQEPATKSDESIELQLAGKLDTLSEKIAALENKMTQTEQRLDTKLSSGLGELAGRVTELQHREDVTDEKLRNGGYRATSITPKAAPKPTPATRGADTGKEVKPHPVVRPHYTVQAGAPGLAIITDGAGKALRVTPGSPIEGWGSVLTIKQAGDGWIVQTEHGVIR